ncbi:MAG: hypothetical protein WB566_16535 [Terriglobales bacterium]
MVVNRPGIGVRNPIRFSTPLALCVQKRRRRFALDPVTHMPINHFPVSNISWLRIRVSPVRLLEAAPQS